MNLGSRGILEEIFLDLAVLRSSREDVPGPVLLSVFVVFLKISHSKSV